jgi:hypothetical protein
MNSNGYILLNSPSGYLLLNKDKAYLSCSGSIHLDSSGGQGNIYIKSNLTQFTTYINVKPPPISMQINASGQLYNETVLINDNSNNQYLPNMYDNSFISTGAALTLVAKDNSSNTYFRAVAPNKMGLAINGGVFPNDTNRSMASIGLNDNCGNFTSSMTIVSGNSLLGNTNIKYLSTIGINTYAPKTDQYVLDINGPTRIGNGEINTTLNTNFQINQMKFFPYLLYLLYQL